MLAENLQNDEKNEATYSKIFINLNNNNNKKQEIHLKKQIEGYITLKVAAIRQVSHLFRVMM